MSTLLETLRVVVEQSILSLGYFGLALLMLAENLFPPIPSEMVLPFAGSLVAEGKLNLVWALVATTVGAVLGALLLYYLGLWWGEARVRALFRRYGRWLLLSEEDFDQALTVFRRFEGPAVFLGRFLPGVRSLISIPAGVARMPLGKFLAFTILGTLLWNSLLGYAGVLLNQNWTRVLTFTERYEAICWILLAGLVLAWVAWRLSRRSREQEPPRGSEP